MRKIAIVGSGISGMLVAHGLAQAGYEVTVYSERSADHWLNESRPTGAAARFALALSYERELGLNHWETEAPKIGGASVVFLPKTGNQLLTLAGRFNAGHGLAIDVRLQSHRWMNDFEKRGGRIVIEPVTVARLDEIAAQSDLTILASGRAELSRLFERDAARSPYDKPQRQLAMVLTTGGAFALKGVPFLPVKFSIFAPHGEAFWLPFFHKDAGPSWCLGFEAKEGGPIDRFRNAKSGDEALAIAKQVIKELTPWDYEWANGMELADKNGWLVGAFAPTVRKPVGRLPSGRVVTGIGDTLMTMDPIAGQGANNCTKMARHLVDSIIARGSLPFDARFMETTFEAYWNDHGERGNTFTNLLLEPMPLPGQELLTAQYGSTGTGNSAPQRVADAFVANFSDPRLSTGAFQDMAQAKALIEKSTGSSWRRSALRGRLGIGLGQLKQALGMNPGHPSSDAPVVTGIGVAAESRPMAAARAA